MLDTTEALELFQANGTKRSYPAKHTIIHAGDPSTSLYLILEGSVSIMLEDEDGREMVLAYLNPGDFFGEICLFREMESRSAIVRTRADTVVCELGYQKFRNLAKDNSSLLYELSGQLALRLRDTSRRLGDLAFLDVAGRVAHCLLALCQQPDATPMDRGTLVRISRQELARLAGCSREMAGRVLKKIEEDGIVEVDGRNILVLGKTEAPLPRS